MHYNYKPKEFETPWLFNEAVECQNLKIEYKRIKEAYRGGPRIGKLYVNDVEIMPNHFFGGPLLLNGERLYAPLFEYETFWLFCWNLASQKCWVSSKKILPNLIILDKVHDDTLYYKIGNKASDRKDIQISKVSFSDPYPKAKDFTSLRDILLSVLVCAIIAVIALVKPNRYGRSGVTYLKEYIEYMKKVENFKERK